jgi:HKD family nuclease
MYIQIIDNVEHNVAAALTPLIEAATDVRIAVAFVSSDGLSRVMPALQRALGGGASVEFLVGMDAHATDPAAVRTLFDLSRQQTRASLLCFASRRHSSIYHPKMYLMRDAATASAILGSSNLTGRGLVSNIEANLLLREQVQAEIISDLYSTYSRLKYHPDRVIPDDEFIDLFAQLCGKARSGDRKLASDPVFHGTKEAFLKKAALLQRPNPSRNDLIGWLDLVYDALPEGTFNNADVYTHESEFQDRYPHNLNIKAKIRQQLQLLEQLGFVEHPERGIWRKLSAGGLQGRKTD